MLHRFVDVALSRLGEGNCSRLTKHDFAYLAMAYHQATEYPEDPGYEIVLRDYVLRKA